MNTSNRIHLPQNVENIIQNIEKAGYEAYAVGGCVRDSFLGKEPDDWDITTSATPEQIKELFRRTVDTGIAHGTVTVMIHQTGYEVTTYRVDGDYKDSRHPEEVFYTSSLTEDLKRRDFTINAMAYNSKHGLVDVFGGMEDLKKGVIRAVGDPEERFTEDALRIMRAVRFSAQLGYTIEEKTKDALKKLAGNLEHISAERIQTELNKLLLSSHPEKMKVLFDCGITKVIMPEFDRIMETEQNNPHHKYSVGDHTIKALQNVGADKVLRLTMLFHDFGKPLVQTEDADGIHHFHGHARISEQLAVEILQRLKYDNDTIRRVRNLVRYHDLKIEMTHAGTRRAIYKVGEDMYPLLFEVQMADLSAQSEYKREEKINRLERMKELYREVQKANDCVSLKTLAVSGKDVLEWGVKPGKEVGEVLARLLDAVMDHPDWNDREVLYQYWKTM